MMENLHPKESFAIIQKIISERKKQYEENGFFLIFWGILIVIAGVLQFIMLKINFYPKESSYIWGILMSLGYIFTVIAKMRESNFRKKENKSVDWSGWIWCIGGTWAMLSGFIIKSYEYIILLIYLPFTIITMMVALQIKNKVWVITSLISIGLIYSTFFVKYNIYLALLSAILGVLLFLIPGIQLYYDYKRRYNV